MFRALEKPLSKRYAKMYIEIRIHNTSVTRMRLFLCVPRFVGVPSVIPQGHLPQRPTGTFFDMFFLTPRPPVSLAVFSFVYTWGINMKINRILFGLVCVMIAQIQLYAGSFISGMGFVAECPITRKAGDPNDKLGQDCDKWCSNLDTNQYNDGVYYYGEEPLYSFLCSYYGIESSYVYCCGNKTATSIMTSCKCADKNQVTVNGGKDAYRILPNDYGAYDITCSNLYCFCNTSYYGPRQLMNVSTDGTCTKCPCVEDVFRQAGGSQLCGWTANNYQNLKNPDAPSTTIKDCKAGPVTSAMPEQYRTYFDPSGVFVLSGPCNYTE